MSEIARSVCIGTNNVRYRTRLVRRLAIGKEGEMGKPSSFHREEPRVLSAQYANDGRTGWKLTP